MTGEEAGSVTRWVGGLKAGDAEAARVLWERYFVQLVGMARGRLRAAPALPPTRKTPRYPRLRVFAAVRRRAAFRSSMTERTSGE